MKKQFTAAFILVIFLIPFSVWGWGVIGMGGGPAAEGNGNNFSSDANCTALWKFESGALVSDSKGTNTLTNHNTVAENTVDYKEGACSADFELANSEYFSITDANLDTGYPLKNGDANKKISVCGWFRLESLASVVGAHEAIYSKYDLVDDKRSLLLFVSDVDDKLTLYIGYNSGASYDTYTHATVLTTDRWYHYGVTWQDSDRSYRIRIWDDTASAIHGSDLTGTGSNNISIEDVSVTVGARGDTNKHWDGEQDELVIFKDILSVAEIDKIRAGTYP